MQKKLQKNVFLIISFNIFFVNIYIPDIFKVRNIKLSLTLANVNIKVILNIISHVPVESSLLRRKYLNRRYWAREKNNS